jgi:hypothetical protein
MPAESTAGVTGPSAPARRSAAIPTIAFEYVGTTGLTVFGGATRARYRFAVHGARVAVDARDAASLDAVRVVRRVRR